jgi:hypothetical protein
MPLHRVSSVFIHCGFKHVRLNNETVHSTETHFLETEKTLDARQLSCHDGNGPTLHGASALARGSEKMRKTDGNAIAEGSTPFQALDR